MSLTTLEKTRRQEKRWQRMQRRGQLLELLLNASIWGGSCVAAALVWATLHKLGWVKPPVTISWVDVVIWTVTGLIVGAIEWSDLKRRFRNPPPEEDWMAK